MELLASLFGRNPNDRLVVNVRALDAALPGGRERVFRALLGHPLVGQTDIAETLADRMIDANREYLAWA